MSKKVNHAAPKSAKINPASDATNPEKEAQQAIPSPAPKAISSPTSDAKPADDYRTELVKKAQAAKNAAAVGLIPQEQADALWARSNTRRDHEFGIASRLICFSPRRAQRDTKVYSKRQQIVFFHTEAQSSILSVTPCLCVRYFM